MQATGDKELHGGKPTIITEYKVKCVRCGVLYAWTWAQGDPPLLANWVALHKALAKHDGLFHWLRFVKKEIQIKDLEKSASVGHSP